MKIYILEYQRDDGEYIHNTFLGAFDSLEKAKEMRTKKIEDYYKASEDDFEIFETILNKELN